MLVERRNSETEVTEALTSNGIAVPGKAACRWNAAATESGWQGEAESASETLLLLKTGPEQLAALEARLRELHSYQTPEFLVIGVDAASQPYLDWLRESLRQPQRLALTSALTAACAPGLVGLERRLGDPLV